MPLNQHFQKQRSLITVLNTATWKNPLEKKIIKNKNSNNNNIQYTFMPKVVIKNKKIKKSDKQKEQETLVECISILYNFTILFVYAIWSVDLCQSLCDECELEG